jgi:hypothetical protein
MVQTINSSKVHTFLRSDVYFLISQSAENATQAPITNSSGMIQGTFMPERCVGCVSGAKGIQIAISRQSAAVTVSGVILILFIQNVITL